MTADPPLDPKMIELIVRQGIPHCRELDIRVLEASYDRLVLKLPYQARLTTDPSTGILAGGAVTTLIDSVCGMAVQLALRKLTAIATLDLRIDYLRPSAPAQDVLASAVCYKMTRQIAFVRSVAWNNDEADPVAHCAASFMVGSSDKSVVDPARVPVAGQVS